MKVAISDLIDKKPDFSTLTYLDKVKYLAYFRVKTTEDPYFSTKNLEDIFALVCIKAPANMADIFAKLEKKNVFLKQNMGYIFSREAQIALDKEFPDNQHKVKAADSLRDLCSRVTQSDLRNYIEEAILCYECEAYRASIVMMWISTMDHMHDYIITNKLIDFNKALKLKNIKKLNEVKVKDDFSEIIESEFIELCRSAKIITQDQRKILDEKLGIRNSSAHPNGIKIHESKATNFIEDLIDNIILKIR